MCSFPFPVSDLFLLEIPIMASVLSKTLTNMGCIQQNARQRCPWDSMSTKLDSWYPGQSWWAKQVCNLFVHGQIPLLPGYLTQAALPSFVQASLPSLSSKQIWLFLSDFKGLQINIGLHQELMFCFQFPESNGQLSWYKLNEILTKSLRNLVPSPPTSRNDFQMNLALCV